MMGETTAIQWCDHTANTWWGCVKVSAGCKNCYADGEAKRRGFDLWGPKGSRRMIKGIWADVYKWAKAAAAAGERRRVFWGSMMDVCEDRPELVEPRKRFMGIIEECEDLDFLILTKRPENYAGMLWSGQWPANAWAGTSVEDQETLDRRQIALKQVLASVRWLSVEPLLSELTLGYALALLTHLGIRANEQEFGPDYYPNDHKPFIDWVIVGGESGPGARPFDLAWARAIVKQCAAAKVPVFVKQLGARAFIDRSPEPAGALARKHGIGPLVAEFLGLKDKKGGDMAEWPEEFADLRVREFPKAGVR